MGTIGALTHTEGGLGFGVEADLRIAQNIFRRLTELRRRTRDDDPVQGQTGEAGQAVELRQLRDSNDGVPPDDRSCPLYMGRSVSKAHPGIASP